MKKEVDKLLSFWNSSLGGYEPEAIKERWIYEDSFIEPMNKYVLNKENVLDYGCGSGWLSYELSLINPSLNIIGMDPSANAIELNSKCAELSLFKNLKFVCGMEDKLKDYPTYFDSVISVNTLDVLPEEIIRNILFNVKSSLKKDGHFIVCINPDFPMEFLKSVGYVEKNGYIYKDDILRGIIKTNEEWISLFNEYFSLVEYKEFILMEREKNHKRRMFVLINNK